MNPARLPTFEIVHSDAGPYHLRVRSGNGRVTLQSETYTRRHNAVKAAVHHILALVQPDTWELLEHGLVVTKDGQDRLVAIRDVDERGQS